MMDERFARVNSAASGATRSIDHYVLGKTLGIGSFGKVKCASTNIRPRPFMEISKSPAKKLRVRFLESRKQKPSLYEYPFAPSNSTKCAQLLTSPLAVAVHKETAVKVAIKVLNKKKVRATIAQSPLPSCARRCTP